MNFKLKTIIVLAALTMSSMAFATKYTIRKGLSTGHYDLNLGSKVLLVTSNGELKVIADNEVDTNAMAQCNGEPIYVEINSESKSWHYCLFSDAASLSANQSRTVVIIKKLKEQYNKKSFVKLPNGNITDAHGVNGPTTYMIVDNSFFDSVLEGITGPFGHIIVPTISGWVGAFAHRFSLP